MIELIGDNDPWVATTSGERLLFLLLRNHQEWRVLADSLKEAQLRLGRRYENPRLRDQVDPGDPDKVRAVTKDVLETLNPEFFEAGWASTSYDTRAGRDLVMADLETLSFNVANAEPWYEGLKVISRNWLQEKLAASGGAVLPPAADDGRV